MNDLKFSVQEIMSVAKEMGLPEDAFIDHERKTIIENWSDADIVACPGSGKTTVLLAQLLLLSRRMPFENDKGICVLTHTNVAINEIKIKLGQKAEILFKHPNFFGTIQSFADRFLASPCCAKTHGIRPKIDNTKYFQILEKKYKHPSFPKRWFDNNKKQFKSGYDYFKSLRYNFEDITIISDSLYGASFLNSETKTYIKTKNIKKEISQSGIICFEDAFSIANWYLENNQKLKNFFSSRFQFLFIDEMQDTQKHQSDILNKIFDEIVIKQYYGDPDQAIFNGIKGGESAWQIDRDNKYEIKHSKRFGKSISTCIFPFRKEISDVVGQESLASIKPHIILYEQEKEVLKKYAELILKYKLNETEEYIKWNKPSYPFNAVGFVGKDKDDESKITINNYFKEFSKTTNSRKMYFSNLISYFQKRPDENVEKEGTQIYYQLIINALLELLDKSDCKNPDNSRYFTESDLLKYLREKDENTFLEFHQRIAEWIKDLHCEEKKPDQIKDEFVEYLRQNLKEKMPVFKNDILNSDFVKNNADKIEDIDNLKREGNIAEIDGIKIKVGTVHSVKGETHLSTLFLETYHRKSCESECFADQFCGGTYKKLSRTTQFKTAYVAMSRPSHLLCVALGKNRAKCTECSDEDRKKCTWEIVEKSGNRSNDENLTS